MARMRSSADEERHRRTIASHVELSPRRWSAVTNLHLASPSPASRAASRARPEGHENPTPEELSEYMEVRGYAQAAEWVSGLPPK